MPTTQADMEHKYLLEVSCKHLDLNMKYIHVVVSLYTRTTSTAGSRRIRLSCRRFALRKRLVMKNKSVVRKHSRSKPRGLAEAKNLFKVPAEGPDSVNMASCFVYSTNELHV